MQAGLLRLYVAYRIRNIALLTDAYEDVEKSEKPLCFEWLDQPPDNLATLTISEDILQCKSRRRRRRRRLLHCLPTYCQPYRFSPSRISRNNLTSSEGSTTFSASGFSASFLAI